MTPSWTLHRTDKLHTPLAAVPNEEIDVAACAKNEEKVKKPLNSLPLFISLSFIAK